MPDPFARWHGRRPRPVVATQAVTGLLSAAIGVVGLFVLGTPDAASVIGSLAGMAIAALVIGVTVIRRRVEEAEILERRPALGPAVRAWEIVAILAIGAGFLWMFANHLPRHPSVFPVFLPLGLLYLAEAAWLRHVERVHQGQLVCTTWRRGWQFVPAADPTTTQDGPGGRRPPLDPAGCG